MKISTRLKTVLIILIIAVGVGSVTWYWRQSQSGKIPAGLLSGNGRIESDQIDISAKSSGRVQDVLVQEGDLVNTGQVLAKMDVTELEAQRAKYVADWTTADASRLEAQATLIQRKAELRFKESNLQRANSLADKDAISRQAQDEAQSERDSARAILEAAGQVVVAKERSIDAAKALVDQIDAQIADATLRAPVDGRVLYRLANPGEVVGAGGKVLTIVNLSEIYMEIYLPSEQAIRVSTGSQARIVLDGAPFALPAKVTFVSPDAQFTPKQVETRSERDKLMFRAKLRIPPSLVSRHIEHVKTGARGVGYVRLDPNPPEWPEFLQVRLPGDPADAGN
ncbi:HlyD family secretion protein [Rhizobium sp. P28RR-XV]|uniref:HlyD family secretion protein n=1 Tax=Rhizobium sp. P28RR-XV TaxID=2726737 RepID=UPI001456E4DF|nr:HlyD family efflux transporter periplasmic adaptor subunit [Rhizobium sp. P28RR-XV]NLR88401.1 HlyD family efflux transporter periplasmic adaptor subunit [Rhizobium sp. P28RR-XV]